MNKRELIEKSKVLQWLARKLRSIAMEPREKRATLDDYYRMYYECLAIREAEDFLFDEYLSVKDRPRVKEMMMLATGGPTQEIETVDWNHWEKWKRARLNEKGLV